MAGSFICGECGPQEWKGGTRIFDEHFDVYPEKREILLWWVKHYLYMKKTNKKLAFCVKRILKYLESYMQKANNYIRPRID